MHDQAHAEAAAPVPAQPASHARDREPPWDMSYEGLDEQAEVKKEAEWHAQAGVSYGGGHEGRDTFSQLSPGQAGLTTGAAPADGIAEKKLLLLEMTAGMKGGFGEQHVTKDTFSNLGPGMQPMQDYTDLSIDDANQQRQFERPVVGGNDGRGVKAAPYGKGHEDKDTFDHFDEAQGSLNFVCLCLLLFLVTRLFRH